MGNPLTLDKSIKGSEKREGVQEGVALATQATREVKRIRSAWTRSVVSSTVIDMLIASPRNP